MNRLWIGIGLLAALLAVGVAMLFVSRDFHETFTESLEQASRSAMAGNWQDAGQQAAKGKEKWERYQRFWAAFTDHEPVEDMENLFSQLEVYQARQLEVDFAAVCQNLVNLAAAMDESHSLSWWSLL